MIIAFIRLAKITLIVAIFTVFIVSALRIMGLKQTYSSWDHELLKTPLNIFHFSHQVINPQDAIFYIPIKYIPEKDQWITSYQDREAPFKEVLHNLPKVKGLYLKISSQIGNLTQLSEYLKAADYTEHQIIVQSKSSFFSLELKKKYPQWLFVAPVADLSKFQFMASVYLETMASFSGDIILVDEDHAQFLNKKTLTELIRRKKIFIKDAQLNLELPLPIEYKGQINF